MRGLLSDTLILVYTAATAQAFSSTGIRSTARTVVAQEMPTGQRGYSYGRGSSRTSKGPNQGSNSRMGLKGSNGAPRGSCTTISLRPKWRASLLALSSSSSSLSDGIDSHRRTKAALRCCAFSPVSGWAGELTAAAGFAVTCVSACCWASLTSISFWTPLHWARVCSRWERRSTTSVQAACDEWVSN